MRPQSCKAKGRRLQQEVRDAVLATFPSLEPDDVRSTSMGASGADLLLSPAAKRVIPFDIECKNQEALNIWAALDQAGANASHDRVPLLVFRRNKSATYAALPFLNLLHLLQKANGSAAANSELERDLAKTEGPERAAWLARGVGAP